MLAEMPHKTPLPWRKVSARQIILLFALIMALFYTVQGMSSSYRMGHDQTYVGTMLAKDHDPSLYLRDYAFHDDSLYRSYIPVIRWFFDKLTRLTGSFDHALLAMVPVVVFLFALGTGLLLLEWSQSLGIALVITLLAIPYRAAPSGELWGVGGIEFILARTMATALAPFVFILFFRFLGKPAARYAAFTGFATGLLAFLHPPTALFLGELFAGIFILNHFRNRRDWLQLAVMLGCYFLVALFPLTFMEQQAPASAAALDFAGLHQVIHSYLKIPLNWGHFPGDPTERRVWLFLGATLILGLNYLFRQDATAAGGITRLVLGQPGHLVHLLAVGRQRGWIYLAVCRCGSLCDLAISTAGSWTGRLVAVQYGFCGFGHLNFTLLFPDSVVASSQLFVVDFPGDRTLPGGSLDTSLLLSL